ncbi:formate dehydrogenase subunit delta [Amycolatopsis sp. H20-H5]|uniref:formate dehydrogenase subunit delta n=1 Tax=Amycolatopsis sp. H20-H5 TaxID=3046309 RepID=UPI002DBA94F5|nr:formate dehydrogenase subunit delta [Amycolatopsis sp. H20-H5]MEC3975922.1 formate dehydrogenase subunit delta [Amycolatopsis sp. H20-H5]
MTHTVSPQVRLANEIALQFRGQDVDAAAAKIDRHIRDFWDPRMRADLLHRAETGVETMDPLVVAAVRLLRHQA